MKDYPLLFLHSIGNALLTIGNGLLTIRNGLLTEEIETTNGRIMLQTLLC